MTHSLKLRTVGVALLVALVATAAAGSYAAIGAVSPYGPAAAGQYPAKKITICHHANKKNKKTRHVTIRISPRALKGHRKHGDTLGSCATKKSKKLHSRKAHVKKYDKKARR